MKALTYTEALKRLPKDPATGETPFMDISNEEYRQYNFAGEPILTVHNPVALAICPCGNHSIVDDEGTSYVVLDESWDVLEYKAKEGAPLFSF